MGNSLSQPALSQLYAAFVTGEISSDTLALVEEAVDAADIPLNSYNLNRSVRQHIDKRKFCIKLENQLRNNVQTRKWPVNLMGYIPHDEVSAIWRGLSEDEQRMFRHDPSDFHHLIRRSERCIHEEREAARKERAAKAARRVQTEIQRSSSLITTKFHADMIRKVKEEYVAHQFQSDDNYIAVLLEGKVPAEEFDRIDWRDPFAPEIPQNAGKKATIAAVVRSNLLLKLLMVELTPSDWIVLY